MSEQPPQYQVGDIVNGNRWTGTVWEPVVSGQVPDYYPPPPQYVVPLAYSVAPVPAPLPTGLAATSMILGIIGLPLSLFCGIGIFLSIPAFVTGIVAFRKCTSGEASGKGMAIAGIVTGGLAIVLLVAFGILYGFASISSS